MKCPTCKNNNLSPTKLDEELPVLGCRDCGGTLVSLLYYRDWAERSANNDEIDSEVSVEQPEDSQTALSCPKCQRLMTKYTISGSTNNKLDLCGSCDEAWIDGGEWELLKSLKLSKNFPAVFSDVWQRKVRKEISEAKHIERFTEILGSEDTEKANQFRLWIKDHPRRAEILFFVGKS
ncbi:zf-TFIIB domain-containing protein [Gilvimarinus sp. SDUM040013]|uniref:Zf-TFIIB domain-containing protein n=1 Tax=Gilvimarinus gilvus TaxID=3058038 RepID=A0ABU4S6F4_9GAMM|nr:zf-TFIIB domain-containing protein [Gilvimarinus sp. SDUM040013]MDO3385369.1 zf-TFIIB domain-containing protein [Gilvimarinus sp. SDUM040013]MDX6850944.1 zf-TFIIB domain-containing protein [Gilvimarinus sp. SDUM040013]